MLKFAAKMALSTTLIILPAVAVAAGQKISNNLDQCRAGSGPAVLVNVSGIKASSGKLRLQSYRALKSEWLKKGAWLHRIETPAKAGTMTFCVPITEAGNYGIAVRHDINGNNKTDITKDGGAMSNNPSINIFNLGKPSYKKTRFSVGDGVKTINIKMKYL